MKRVISILFVCFMCLCIITPCLAEEFINPPVVDDAGYLSEDEFSELTQKAEEVRQNHNFEVAIVTETEMSGYDATSSADDIYDYLGYGAGADADGIMFYICADEREYHITTHADGLRVFNDSGIRYLEDNIRPYLSDDDYFSAMQTFIELSDELLYMAENGEPYNEEIPTSATYVIIILAIALIVPLIIAKIMTSIKAAQMKTAVSDNYAANYVKEGSKHINVSRDMFLYSQTTKTAKPKNNSSSSHTSSSGRTHGGGGGSF